MIHPMPIQVLLTSTFEPLVRQLSASLARGVRLVDQFVQDDPTPQKLMAFEGELSVLLREGVSWTHLGQAHHGLGFELLGARSRR